VTDRVAPAAGVHNRRPGAWSVRTTRPDPRVTLFDVQLSDYHEYFLVAAGQRSVSITMFDPSDQSHPEPQTFHFAKPYGWDDTLEGDEALLQVWQSVGVLR
jgi:hypothetical protein